MSTIPVPTPAGPMTCNAIYDTGQRRDGVFTIQPALRYQPFQVYCDFDATGAWLVIQRRIQSTERFTRAWDEYRRGFGDFTGAFWLGLDKLHYLTSSRKYMLRIELRDWERETKHAEYQTFIVGPHSDKYRLRVGNYSGDAGDSMHLNNGMRFSTRDQDNDESLDKHCGEVMGVGWWYWGCSRSHLNNPYHRTNRCHTNRGITWADWRGPKYSLKAVTMKIRAIS